MRRILQTRTAAALFTLVGIIGTIGGVAAAADQDPNDALVQMIVELVSDTDSDMRALGLQQVREEAPGEAATSAFVELLPKLPPGGQAGLLQALAGRGDPAAHPAILKMVESEDASVRAAALGALGSFGDTADVPLLAEKAATATDAEKIAARQSLIRLHGDEVNATILVALKDGEPEVRTELLGVLAARNAKEAMPTVLECAEDPNATVRLAALDALRFLADETHTAKVVDILKTAHNDAERQAAELALLSVCSQGREACVEEIVAGLADADVPSRVALLRGLARAGGTKALEEVVARLQDQDQAVRDEALRLLSIWGDPAVSPHLMKIAQSAADPRPRVLAVRGLVRLARPDGDEPADLKMLGQALDLANRPQEKRLVLGALSTAATPEALALVTPILEHPAVTEEAALAAVIIAEKMKEGDKQPIRAAMKQVLEKARNEKIRNRATKVLGSL